MGDTGYGGTKRNGVREERRAASKLHEAAPLAAKEA